MDKATGGRPPLATTPAEFLCFPRPLSEGRTHHLPREAAYLFPENGHAVVDIYMQGHCFRKSDRPSWDQAATHVQANARGIESIPTVACLFPQAQKASDADAILRFATLMWCYVVFSERCFDSCDHAASTRVAVG